MPHMFEGLQSVAARIDFLSDVHMYVVGDVDEAVRLINVDRRQLLH